MNTVKFALGTAIPAGTFAVDGMSMVTGVAAIAVVGWFLFKGVIARNQGYS